MSYWSRVDEQKEAKGGRRSPPRCKCRLPLNRPDLLTLLDLLLYLSSHTPHTHFVVPTLTSPCDGSPLFPRRPCERSARRAGGGPRPRPAAWAAASRSGRLLAPPLPPGPASLPPVRSMSAEDGPFSRSLHSPFSILCILHSLHSPFSVNSRRSASWPSCRRAWRTGTGRHSSPSAPRS